MVTGVRITVIYVKGGPEVSVEMRALLFTYSSVSSPLNPVAPIINQCILRNKLGGKAQANTAVISHIDSYVACALIS